MQSFTMRSLREGKNNLNDCSAYVTMSAKGRVKCPNK